MSLTTEERLKNSQEDCRLLRKDNEELAKAFAVEKLKREELDDVLKSVMASRRQLKIMRQYAKRRLVEQAKKYAKAKVEIRNLRRKVNGN